jgi:hypothetical protein
MRQLRLSAAGAAGGAPRTVAGGAVDAVSVEVGERRRSAAPLAAFVVGVSSSHVNESARAPPAGGAASAEAAASGGPSLGPADHVLRLVAGPSRVGRRVYALLSQLSACNHESTHPSH